MYLKLPPSAHLGAGGSTWLTPLPPTRADRKPARGSATSSGF
jgi:hypothetical protein